MKKPITENPISLLLLNGGVGKRAEHSEPKQFYELHGHPMMAYAIIAATKVSQIQEIVINAPDGYVERTQQIMQNYAGHIAVQVKECGATRQESSLILAEAASHDIVIMHETARPLINARTYFDLIDHAADNVGYFVDIPFSMCRLDPKTRVIRKNVRRDKVYNIQLPQKFNKASLLSAHTQARSEKKTFTEDAVMMFKMTSAEVHAIDGDSQNIKVTTPEDFAIAEQLMGGAKD